MFLVNLLVILSTLVAIGGSQHHYDHFHLASGSSYMPGLNYQASSYIPWGSGWYTVATIKPSSSPLLTTINTTNSPMSLTTAKGEKRPLKKRKSKKENTFSAPSNTLSLHSPQALTPRLIDPLLTAALNPLTGPYYRSPYECNCNSPSKPPKPNQKEEEESEDDDEQQQNNRGGQSETLRNSPSSNDFDDEESDGPQTLESKKKKSRLQRATAKILESANPSSLEFLCEKFMEVNGLTFNHSLGRFTQVTSGKLRQSKSSSNNKSGKSKKKKSSRLQFGTKSRNRGDEVIQQQQELTSEQEDRTTENPLRGSLAPFRQFLATTAKLPLASRIPRNPARFADPYIPPVTSGWRDDFDDQANDDDFDSTEPTTRSGRTSTTHSDRLNEDERDNYQQQKQEQIRETKGRSRSRDTEVLQVRSPVAAVKGRLSSGNNNDNTRRRFAERD